MTTKKTTTTDKTRDRKIAEVSEAVRKRLDIETLETRNWDRLDFHDISVAAIRDVIQIAFDAGYAAATVK